VLQSANLLDDALLAGALKDADPSVRGWAVRLIAQQWIGGVPALAELAKTEPSAQVRRELASALSYLPLAQRAAIAEPLLARAEDAKDHNIPLLLWYGIEPLVGADAARGLALAAVSRHPQTTDFVYRRLAGDARARSQVLSLALRETDAPRRSSLVGRVVEGVRQAGSFSAPEGWAVLVAGLRQGASPDLLANLNELDALAGDKASRAYYRGHLADEKAPLPARQRALAVLVASRDRAAAPVIHQVFAEKTTPSFRRALIQALASVGDENSPAVLLGRFGVFSPEQLGDAVSALAGNPAGGTALLAAVAAGKADKALLSPLVIRQLKSLGDKSIDAQLAAVVGVVNATKADFAKNKAKYEAMLNPAAVRKGDLAAGRQLFTSACGICHTFGYIGNQVGPGLAGSNIGKLDYFLENVLNPNGVIGKDYQLNVFKLKGGATMSGIVQFEDAQSFRLVMPGGAKFTVAKGEVEQREILPMSLMPEGLLDALTKEQVINLVAYLQFPDGFPAAAPGVWRLEGALEGETLKVISVTGGKTSGQKMTSFKASRWSGNDHLWWTGGKVGDTLTLALPVAAKGTYEVKFVGTKAHDYGSFELRLDGKLLDEEGYDFYNPAEVVTTGELNGGRHELDAGEHRLEIKILTPNPAATPRNMFGLDYLKLERK
jgi:putative heme-binding domain-containing protein